MGWISYREDIEEQLNDNFRNSKNKLSRDAEEVSKIRDELRRLLELATSPDIDLAYEFESKRKLVDSL